MLKMQELIFILRSCNSSFELILLACFPSYQIKGCPIQIRLAWESSWVANQIGLHLKIVQTLDKFGVSWEAKSSHRTPDLLFDYAKNAESRGLKCLIASGWGAHLPGMAHIDFLARVWGSYQIKDFAGVDPLSIVQMYGYTNRNLRNR